MVLAKALLVDILAELQASATGFQASMIISRDGLLMATQKTAFPVELDEARAAAMTTALFAYAKRGMQAIKFGGVQQVLLKGEQGYFVILAVSEYVMLSVLLSHQAQLGLSLLSCERCAQKIAATGIVQPSPRMGLIYLGKSNNIANSDKA